MSLADEYTVVDPTPPEPGDTFPDSLDDVTTYDRFEQIGQFIQDEITGVEVQINTLEVKLETLKLASTAVAKAFSL